MFHVTGGYNNPYSPARYYNPSYSTPSYGEYKLQTIS